MSAEQHREPWQGPQPFRDAVYDLEAIADRLLAQLDGQLLVPVADVDFLVRRLKRLARGVNRALPPEVS